MIKNRQSLNRGKLKSLRANALRIIETGLSAVEVKGAMKRAKLPALGKFDNVYVVGFGKASASMAEALEARLGKRIATGTVVSIRKAKTKRIKGFKGTHPIPSATNVKAAKEILGICEKSGKKDLVIVLVSGGGSALLSIPAKGIGLRELQKTNRLLVNSNATIQEINTVRKHVSAVKGGQLAGAAYPARVHALLVSDVIGNSLSTIASGPTVADSSSFKGAMEVLKRHGLWKKTPAKVRKRLFLGINGKTAETPKQNSRIFRKVTNKILLDNGTAIRAMQARAKQLGFRAVVYSKAFDGEAGHAGKFLVRNACMLGLKWQKPVALIAGGETTVTVRGKGKGGRNQEMVLAALPELEKAKKAVFASVGSDGIDGNSRAAGAIADSTTLSIALDKGLRPSAFLARNDSNGFFQKIKGEVLTGYTETNVMDLQLVLVK